MSVDNVDAGRLSPNYADIYLGPPAHFKSVLICSFDSWRTCLASCIQFTDAAFAIHCAIAETRVE